MKLYYSFFIIFLYSCTPQVESLHEFPTHVIRQSEQNVSFDSLLYDLEFVALRNSPFIGQISFVRYSNGHYFIADKSQNDIKVYDKDFEFIRILGKTGLGPGEYRRLDNFIVRKNSLIIYSALDMATYEYDLKGSFIDKTKLDDFPFRMASVGKSIVTYSNFNPASENRFNLKKLNSEGQVIKVAEPYSIELSQLIGYSGGIYEGSSSDEVFYYQPPLSDSIFVYNEELQVERVYQFKDLVNNPFPGGIYSESFNVGTRNNYGHLSHLEGVFEDYMWLFYKDPPHMKPVFVDTYKKMYYEIDKIENPMLYYFLSNVQTKDDSGYFYSIPSEYVELIVDSPNAETLLPVLEKFSLSMDKLQNENFNYLIRFRVVD